VLSHFSFKESVAVKFFVQDRVFLAGDACHIHSVNGGQGLNTGLADAFNLIWKLNMVVNHGASEKTLQNYENERRPVAQKVITTSGELVRATKYSAHGTHAEDYVKLVQKHAGNITGMGIRYGDEGLSGTRLFDLQLHKGNYQTRLYSLLNYTKFTLLIFGDCEVPAGLPDFVNVIKIGTQERNTGSWVTESESSYFNQAVLVRPDSYIESSVALEEIASLVEKLKEYQS